MATVADPLAGQENNSDTGAGHLTEKVRDNDAGEGSTTEQEQEQEQERQIKLPMGTWLGFHDGETPLMARLAVHDPEEGYYIFVNRNGVKMRQVSSQELHQLIDRGLVDILEANSNFRDEVTEVRKKLDQ